MPRKTQPLAEVFGFPIDNMSDAANRYRTNKLCPFNNKIPNCTKDKANDPLGVCSIFEADSTAITCPIRFRENWIIADDAANFFFPQGTNWTSLTEVKLKDKHGKSAGNIDLVLVAYDTHGKISDFGALEVQGVYISGNVRNPFEHYMKDPMNRANMNWKGRPNFPSPDYLCSSRNQLVPKFVFEGGILNRRRKKMAFAMDQLLFNTLPKLTEVPKHEADIAWLVYGLDYDKKTNRYLLERKNAVYTAFDESFDQITHSAVGIEFGYGEQETTFWTECPDWEHQESLLCAAETSRTADGPWSGATAAE